MDLNKLADDIVERFNTDEKMKSRCIESPEFYRACVYESELIDAPGLDGTDEWDDLIDILETKI